MNKGTTSSSRLICATTPIRQTSEMDANPPSVLPIAQQSVR
ncbi:MAG: hypothetical protein VB143_02340 [Burkholderia sp.]